MMLICLGFPILPHRMTVADEKRFENSRFRWKKRANHGRPATWTGDFRGAIVTTRGNIHFKGTNAQNVVIEKNFKADSLEVPKMPMKKEANGIIIALKSACDPWEEIQFLRPETSQLDHLYDVLMYAWNGPKSTNPFEMSDEVTASPVHRPPPNRPQSRLGQHEQSIRRRPDGIKVDQGHDEKDERLRSKTQPTRHIVPVVGPVHTAQPRKPTIKEEADLSELMEDYTKYPPPGQKKISANDKIRAAWETGQMQPVGVKSTTALRTQSNYSSTARADDHKKSESHSTDMKKKAPEYTSLFDSKKEVKDEMPPLNTTVNSNGLKDISFYGKDSPTNVGTTPKSLVNSRSMEVTKKRPLRERDGYIPFKPAPTESSGPSTSYHTKSNTNESELKHNGEEMNHGDTHVQPSRHVRSTSPTFSFSSTLDKYKYKALYNIGNSCYMNSTLQALSACDSFVNLLMSSRKTFEDSCVEMSPIFDSFSTVLKHLSGAGKEQFQHEFLRKMRRQVMVLSETFREGGGHRQQDAHEFLSALLGIVDDECKGIIHNGWKEEEESRPNSGMGDQENLPLNEKEEIVEMDEGDKKKKGMQLKDEYNPINTCRVIIRDMKTCSECDAISNVNASESELHLGLNKEMGEWLNPTLEELIYEEMTCSRIFDFNCGKCERKGIEVTSHKTFLQLNDFIILVAKRFTYDSNYRPMKLKFPIGMSQYIVLDEFMAKSESVEEGMRKVSVTDALHDTVCLNSTIDSDPGYSVRRQNSYDGKKEEEEEEEEENEKEEKMEEEEKKEEESEENKEMEEEYDNEEEGKKKCSLEMELEDTDSSMEKEGMEEKEKDEDHDEKETRDKKEEKMEVGKWKDEDDGEVTFIKEETNESSHVKKENQPIPAPRTTRRAPKQQKEKSPPPTVTLSSSSHSSSPTRTSSNPPSARKRKPAGVDPPEEDVVPATPDTSQEDTSFTAKRSKKEGEDEDISIISSHSNKKKTMDQMKVKEKVPIWKKRGKEKNEKERVDTFEFELDAGEEKKKKSRIGWMSSSSTPLSPRNTKGSKVNTVPRARNSTVPKRPQKSGMNTVDEENVEPIRGWSPEPQQSGGGKNMRRIDSSTESDEDERDKKEKMRSTEATNEKMRVEREEEEGFGLEEEYEEEEDVKMIGSPGTETDEHREMRRREVKEAMGDGDPELWKDEQGIGDTMGQRQQIPDEKDVFDSTSEEMANGQLDGRCGMMGDENGNQGTYYTTERQGSPELGIYGDSPMNGMVGRPSSPVNGIPPETPRRSGALVIPPSYDNINIITDVTNSNDDVIECVGDGYKEKSGETKKFFNANDRNKIRERWRDHLIVDSSPPKDRFPFRHLPQSWFQDQRRMHDLKFADDNSQTEKTALRTFTGMTSVDRKYNLTHDVESDGNCLFRALSWHLNGGGEDDHVKIRKMLCDLIASNPEHFESRVDEGETVEAHVNRMEQDGEWGTQAELSAAATLFGVDVWTWTENSENKTLAHKWIRYRPLFDYVEGVEGVPYKKDKKDSLDRYTRCGIYLLNEGGYHYRVVLSLRQEKKIPCGTDVYELNSVVHHHGSSVHSGHYTSDVWDKTREKWLHCDDDKVKEVELQKVLLEASDHGYILVYKRMKKD